MLRLVFYRDRRGEWRWRLKARNGRIVADCAEGYRRRGAARRAAARIVDEMQKGVLWC